MKHWFAVAALAAVCASVALAADPPQKIIDDRVAGMKKLGGNLKGASEAATAADAQAQLSAAIAFAESIPSRFPKGTGIGDAGVTKTRARQDIWAKPAEFKAAADAVVKALKAAHDAAGDKAKLGAALKGVGGACKDCHDAFRGPETE
jgi:cytochrome c556